MEDAGGVFNFPNKNSYYKHISNEFLVSDTSNYSYEDVIVRIPKFEINNSIDDSERLILKDKYISWAIFSTFAIEMQLIFSPSLEVFEVIK